MATELTKSQKLKLELTMGLRVLDCSLGKEGEIISNNKENEKKVYDKSLFDYPDYLEIKQEFIRMICQNPYNWKVDLEDGVEVIKKYWFRYDLESSSWEFNEIRQKHWIDGFLEEEKQKIKKCLNSYLESSHQLKKEVLNNLSLWSIFAQPGWIFNDKEKIYLHNGIKERAGAFQYKDGWSGKELSHEDFQEVRNAVTKKIIDRVRQNPQAWRIQNICIFNGDRPDFKFMGGYQEWEEHLIHYSISSEYEWEWEYNFEKQKRKLFRKGMFSSKEWAEIENAINNKSSLTIGSESEEEKKQIIERNHQKREAEKSQLEISTNQNREVGDTNLNEINKGSASTANSVSDEKDQPAEENNQQNQLQKTDNKVYYGIGAISLVALIISMIAVWVKKQKK
ncbi:MAG: hypothetical protein MRERV_21c031 [Mycoplasmataceae bacterium RV_VA103A]|nr:MAG: hypothetical protein MRERV_21c031 [Mycoplasmataceae bacterium RV_VA103A]